MAVALPLNETNEDGDPLHTQHHNDLAHYVNLAPVIYQPLDTDLTAIAGLTPAGGAVVQESGGSWAARTPAQVAATLPADQAAGTASLRTLGTSSTSAAAGDVARPWLAAGNRVVFLGDSQTIGADGAATGARGVSWPNYASIQSSQRIGYIRNAGVSGNTSAQMLSRFDTDVTPYAPNAVTLLAGRNDIGGSVALATFQSNIQAIIAKIRAIGALPVLGTIPPTTGAGGITTTQWNQWLRLYAARNTIPLIDFYRALVDPATGSLLAAYNSGDNIHPNSAGHFLMGQLAASVLAPQLPSTVFPLPCDGADTSNLIGANCCFTTTSLNGNGEPTGFFVANPGGTTNSIITGDTAIKGNWFRMTVAAPASQVQLYKTGYAVTVGHVYLLAGLVRSVLTAGTFSAQLLFAGPGTVRYAMALLDQQVDGQFAGVFTAPAASTSLQTQFTLASGSTGYVQLAQLGIYDLTALGLDGLV